MNIRFCFHLNLAFRNCDFPSAFAYNANHDIVKTWSHLDFWRNWHYTDWSSEDSIWMLAERKGPTDGQSSYDDSCLRAKFKLVFDAIDHIVLIKC